MPDPIKKLDYGVDSEDEDRTSTPFQLQDPTPAPPRSTTERIDNGMLHMVMLKMSPKKAYLNHTNRLQASLRKIAGEALSNVF